VSAPRVFVVVSTRQALDPLRRGVLRPEPGSHRLVAAFTTRPPAVRLAHANNEALRRSIEQGHERAVIAYEVRACRLYEGV